MRYSIYSNPEKTETTTVESIFSAIKKISAAKPRKPFKIFAEETNILGDVIPGFMVYENGKWDIKGLLIAFNLEIAELYREFDEFEFRNNWSLEDFYENLVAISKMPSVCFELLKKTGESEDISDINIGRRSYNIIRAIEIIY